MELHCIIHYGVDAINKNIAEFHLKSLVSLKNESDRDITKESGKDISPLKTK